LPSFGERLKLEREKRKITLEEISATTKIGTRMLQALEGEKFGQLPGGIFNKGFVRAYARAVGLDEDQAVADYLEASGEATPAGPETMARENTRGTSARETEERISRLEAISDSPSRPLPWGAFAVVLLMTALALSLWSHRRHQQERLAARPTVSQQKNSPTSGSGAALEPSPVSAAIDSAPVAAGASSETSSANSGQASPGGGEAAVPSSGEFSVVIQAREESWISVMVDGKATPSELLETGSERTIRARKQVVVKAGNAGGLNFRLDGKKLDVGGDFGEVKTVTIGHAGLLPNASPAPTTP
jgi:cytoskeleton protein RodZ